MDESGKKAFTPHEKNVEQAKAALRQRYDAAAGAVFVMDFKPLDERTDEDYQTIETHRGNLLAFAPELMDERFTKEVETLISRCNEILDEQLKGIFGEE